MNDLKRRVAALEKKLITGETILRVTMPDGRRAEVPTREWWAHRYEWDCDFPCGDWLVRADPNSWPAAILFFAFGFEKAAIRAKERGDDAEYKRLMAERDDFIIKSFGEALP